LFDLGLFVTGRDCRKGFGQPCVRLDGVELADFDERGDDGPVFGTGGREAHALFGDRGLARLDDLVKPAPCMLPLIERLVGLRPTYGYRRITAVLNRLLRSDGLEFAWLGTARSSAWTVVAGAGISGSDVRDMMLMAVERRSSTCRAPETIEMLSDNGSPYTARETRTFACQLGLKPCFTPVRSPQSNGMAEAFVHTFKRDYVQVNPLPDAETVIKLIGGWIEDYNEEHPHSALKWRSPREFRRAQTETA